MNRISVCTETMTVFQQSALLVLWSFVPIEMRRVGQVEGKAAVAPEGSGTRLANHN
jgi:hypothetical protein